MFHECDQCNKPLSAGSIECPHCGDKFDKAVPGDAEIPKRGFTAKATVSTDERMEKTVPRVTSSQIGFKFEANFVIGLIGCAFLFPGAFAPLVSIPGFGSINYVQNGKGDGMIMTTLAGVSLFIVLMRRYQGSWITGASAMGVLSFTYLNFQATMSNATDSMKADLAGNPFRSIGEAVLQSVQLQWGFAILLIAAFLLIGAATIPETVGHVRRKPSLFAPILSALILHQVREGRMLTQA